MAQVEAPEILLCLMSQYACPATLQERVILLGAIHAFVHLLADLEPNLLKLIKYAYHARI